jgi:multicomponent Na+:H+ antiporter subunit E
MKEVILANIRIAYDIVTPTLHLKPGIIAVPISACSNLELLILSNLVSMTPGTLVIDVATDRSILYIHSLYVEDPDTFRVSLKETFEHQLLEVLR